MASTESRHPDDVVVGSRRLTLVALWALFATVVASGFFSLLGPQNAGPETLKAVIALIVIGAVAGLARLGAVGWVVTLCAAGLAAALRLLGAWYMAATYQGNTLVTEPAGYVVFLVLAQTAGIAALAAGYWGMTALVHVRPGSIRVALLGTLVALGGCVGMALLAASGPIVLDPASGSVAVHRVTITESSIDVDAPRMTAGKVVWLATVRGDAPHDLTLVSVEGRGYHALGTPPSGSTDFLLQRGTLAPGHYYFTAGLDRSWTPALDPSGGLPPLQRGRLVVEFEVVR